MVEICRNNKNCNAVDSFQIVQTFPTCWVENLENCLECCGKLRLELECLLSWRLGRLNLGFGTRASCRIRKLSSWKGKSPAQLQIYIYIQYIIYKSILLIYSNRMTFNGSRLQSLALWGLARAVQMLETTTANTGLAQRDLGSGFVRVKLMTAMRRCEAKKNVMQKNSSKTHAAQRFQLLQRPEVAGSCFESQRSWRCWRWKTPFLKG